jgi:tRNA(fMet)-specific endonuclease VapC
MPLFMLDTNAASAVMKGNAQMDERLVKMDPADWCISAVTHSEICFGLALKPAATNLARRAAKFFAIVVTVPWDTLAAQTHGRVRAELRVAGTPIGDFDEMIAAHALSLGAVIVTANERHFRRVQGLVVENWIGNGIES